ncbi:MAG TPA: PAS domain-containing sensor histidine kinase [Telluria sp.]
MTRSAGVKSKSPAAPRGGAVGAGEQFRAIAEIGGEVAWIVDCATGMPTYISASVEALLGYGVGDFTFQLTGGSPDGPLAALCGGLPERLRRFAAGDPTRQHLVREFEQRRRDGGVVAVELVSSLMLGDDGAPVALVGVLRDLSARRGREAEQRRFASMLNHEFRTPLSTIDGAIQRLEATGAAVDQATRQRYRRIAVAVERLIGMLDEYLSPDRMEANGEQRAPDSLDPRALLEEGAAQARAAGRAVTADPCDLPPLLRCEPQGMRLALKVLVDNALRYSPADSPVAIAGRRAGGGIELLVTDHGDGVPEDEQVRIFDKFYRARNAAGASGSGLGLYMARSVVEIHGGSLDMRNLPEGGAQFRIWLPAQGGAGKSVASGPGSSNNPITNEQG